MPSLVVVGNGMVGHRLCERLAVESTDWRIRVHGEEPRPAYDRVRLTSYLGGSTRDELSLAPASWYADHGIELVLESRVIAIDRAARIVRADDGSESPFDALVLATGSAPFVPPPFTGARLAGIFVYRTFEDLDRIRERACGARRAVVIGGGLLGLEAAKAVLDLGLETHVVELAPRLMPRQLDERGGALLARSVEALGVTVHLATSVSKLEGAGNVERVALANGTSLDADLVVISAGIVPRDELARDAGLEVGPRGGVIVDDELRTSDPNVFAVGECAYHRGVVYGLVAPGYDMAAVLAKNLAGGSARFGAGDLGAKLKLLGVDVASFGDPFADARTERSVVFEDLVCGVYRKIALSEDGKRLLGGILVGDASAYGMLLHATNAGGDLGSAPEDLVVPPRSGRAPPSGGGLPDGARVCSCNDVTKEAICRAIRDDDATTVPRIGACTRAGTGCGGCVPLVVDILAAELRALGKDATPRICEHFALTRQELFHVVMVEGHRSFESVLAARGVGNGCEICKPAVASILASLWNDPVMDHQSLQDTNDRFLANMQRGGLYSIVPRVPGGEITPDALVALGTIAKKWSLYTKITGGQRIDLFGARLGELPDIWEELVRAGFESGHAYGKAMRTVKSCVGSTWCRYGVQDSVSMAIRIEERYKGIRAPHKMKSAVSGCARECAEAQSKDFGLIATEDGYDVWVCGNGGMKPRHADLLASSVDEDTAIRLLDRFVMFYVRTADRLTRTSVWLEKLEGGIDYLRGVIVDDALGLGAELDRQMQHLVDSYRCEWAAVVGDPELRARFRHFADGSDDDTVEWVVERGQRRPKLWAREREGSRAIGKGENGHGKRRLPVARRRWVRVASVSDVPRDGGVAVRWGNAQIAIFHFASRGEWYATDNRCPHKLDMVLARGILGDQGGTPKVACPLHKKTFSLEDGTCLAGGAVSVDTFPVRIDGNDVLVELPPPQDLERAVVHEGPRWCEGTAP